MKALIDSQFICVDSPGGRLYLKGVINLSTSTVMNILENNKIPVELRGNFALIWIPSLGSPVLMVDHFSSIPLFYNDSVISSKYQLVVESQSEKPRNLQIEHQQKILNGNSLGPDTPHLGIFRVLPGHYLKNQKQVRYIDFRNYEDTNEPLRVDELRYLIENQFKKIEPRQNTALLLSGGRDSSTLLGVLKKLNLTNKCKIFSIFSSQQVFSEKKIVEKIALDADVSVQYIEVPCTKEDYSEIHAFKDLTYKAKTAAILQAQTSDCVHLSGEIGLGNFGIPPLLSYLINKGNKYCPREMAKMVINKYLWSTYRSVNFYQISPEAMDNHMRIRGMNWNYKETFDTLIEYFERQWEDNLTDDLYNSAWRFRLQENACYRMYHYSQDTKLSWLHPFASWDFIEALLKLPSHSRFGQNYGEKGLYQTLWGPYISKAPWNKPKLGLSLPYQKVTPT